MTLEMRELRGNDLFTLLPIVGKLNIKDEFVNVFNGQYTDSPLNDDVVGMQIVATLLQTVMVNIPKVKGELNSLLADLTGSTVSGIEELSFSDYAELVTVFFKKPELADFFKSIAKLMN